MTGVIESVFNVFSAVATWISETIPSLTSMLYNATDGLTVLGTMAIASLSVSIAFMLIGIIIRFFQFKIN
jgi:hypothetical protein